MPKEWPVYEAIIWAQREVTRREKEIPKEELEEIRKHLYNARYVAGKLGI